MKKLLKVAMGYALFETLLWGILLIYLKKHKLVVANGIDVYKVPKLVTNDICKVHIACATQLLFKPIILVDDDFETIKKQSMCVADFILAHELGHIKLGHVKDNFKKLLSGVKPTRNLQYEIEADTFAVTHYPWINAEDGIRFIHMVKGIEQERIDNMYELHEKQEKEEEERLSSYFKGVK